MNHEIKPLELLFLWRLAVGGGGDWLKDIKPDPQSPARKRLEADGLIEQGKRKSAVWAWHRVLYLAHRSGVGLAGRPSRFRPQNPNSGGNGSSCTGFS